MANSQTTFPLSRWWESSVFRPNLHTASRRSVLARHAHDFLLRSQAGGDPAHRIRAHRNHAGRLGIGADFAIARPAVHQGPQRVVDREQLIDAGTTLVSGLGALDAA